MDIKIKNIFSRFSFKKVTIYLNIFLVISFLVIFLFVGNFMNDNVYKVISIKDDLISDKALMNSLIVNLDVERFENIMRNIERKTIPREIENFKNIFK